ncbi:MAG: hypothetical protein NTX88_02335 [Candidatus Atribacteria bacterium]|nr:hypothetical protein [Candidatus Atribacteria bacterium]
MVRYKSVYGKIETQQMVRTGNLGVIASETDDLIFEDMPVFGHFPFLHHPIAGTVFLSGDEVNTSVGPPGKERIIGVTVFGNSNIQHLAS